MPTKTNPTRFLTLAALFAALLCVVSPWAIPIGAVPLTLATLAVYLAGGLLDAKTALTAVGVYLLLGAVGLPVFSGFAGGLQKLVGPTGGYLIGYLPCAWLTALCVRHFGRKLWSYPLGMVLGTAALYILGTAWFMVQSGTQLLPALGLCVLPFLPGDAVKIIAAVIVRSSLRSLDRNGRGHSDQ